MVAIVYSLLWIIASFKFADRNWKQYYPTLLYAALGNVTYELLCYRYQLWSMQPNGLPYSMIPILLLSFVGMPLSTWIYLSRYPSLKSVTLQGLYILMFSVLFVIMEYVSVKLGAITYRNGWNLTWSLAFVLVMFTMLRFHFKRPLHALILSVFITLTLCMIFDVNLSKMK